MSTPRETRVALVGAGYVSAYHIRALRTLPHVRIVGIADPDVDRAAALGRRFNIWRVFGSLAEMREVRPDVVHILTPPASHARLAIDALDMGCHVFVEKPMAPTAADCEAMIAAAHRAGRVLSVNHSAKDDPVIVQALDLLRRGVCGDVLGVDFHRSSDYPPYAGGALPAHFRDGGYPLLDIGIHALTLMEAFLGPISDVDVRYRSTGTDPNVLFDDWRGTVACAKGTGAFHLSWSARPIRNELFVRGTRADLHIDCFLQTCTVRRSLPGPKPIAAGVNALTEAAATLWHVPKTMWRLASGSLRPSPGIHAGVLRFHEALARGAEPPVTAEQGRRMIAWLAPFCSDANAARDRTLRLGETLEPRSTLVTGASGTLGRALVERLCAAGDRVRVLVRRPSPDLERLPGVQVVYGDLGDPRAVDRAIAGVRLVYHVGATMKGRGWGDFEGGTVAGTANVVKACLAHRVERLVHVSSLTVLDYASQPSRAVVDETAPLEPHLDQRGSYTRSKVLAERIVTDAIRGRGLQAVVVRPGQIIGPGYESVSPYGTIAMAGRWIAIGSGRLKLPLVHVSDVVDALIAAGTRRDVCGSIFHLVDPTPVTQRDYIARCQHRATYVPRPALLLLGSALEAVGKLLGRGLPLTRYRVRSIKELTFDCSAAQRRLGWTPRTGVADSRADHLVEEAAYADAFYERNQANLALNTTFFRKYIAPTDDWDWRQWGAKRLGPVTGGHVLDLGCGAGEEAVYLAKLGARVTAIDISPKGIALTRARAEANGVADAVEARLMRCDPTEFPDGSFDVVHGFGILHHIGLHAGLTEVHRLLRSGGRAVFWEHMGNSALLARLRQIEGHATSGERPIHWAEIATVAPLFQSVDARAFHLVSRLRQRVSWTGHPLVKRIDHALLSILPSLRLFASGVVIVVRK